MSIMADLEVLHQSPPSMHHLYANPIPKPSNLTPPSARKSYALNTCNNNNNNNNTTNNNNNNYGDKNVFVDLGRRSCLLVRDSNRVVRVRKTVVFADARGLALTQVRIMSEPSEVPPFWSHRFLSHLIPSRFYDEVDSCTNHAPDNSQSVPDSWHPKFEQPARDYVAFRRKLEESNVALENVVIVQKDGTSIAVGTVKVKNLDYHKDVVVRYSLNNWKTFNDEKCSHVPISVKSSAFHLHDTFRFELHLPLPIDEVDASNRAEFCLRFHCAGGEFWDNNSGRNYIIQKRHNTNTTKVIDKVREATYASMKGHAWSEFASWQHLENDCPYW